MLILVVAVCTILLVGFISAVIRAVCALDRSNRVGSWVVDILQPMLSTSVAVLLVGAITWGGILLSTIFDARNLEAFYEQNSTVLQNTVKALYKGVPRDEADARFLEGPNLLQVQAYGDVVNNAMSKVLSYNSKLRTHLYWQNSWMGKGLIARVDSDVTYIVPEFIQGE